MNEKNGRPVATETTEAAMQPMSRAEQHRTSGTDEMAAEIRGMFREHGFPEDLLQHFDQIECLSHHQGRETFLVREKESGELFVAKCYAKETYHFTETLNLLAQLEHPGLPASRGRFESETMVCFLRDYIPGTPLNQYAASEDLSREDVVQLCLRLADILIYLHELNPPVIHRDIKGENIIVQKDGQLSLIDFDIARTFKKGGERDTVFFGTKGYAPPEQYGFSQTDHRSDIYSFGVLLRFLLTGSIRANDKIRIYRPLQKIIDRCTAFAPDKRYDSMREVRRDLQRANPRSQLLRKGRTALLLVILIAAAAFAGWQIYEKATYSPYTDGSIVPIVMPDYDRQSEAIAYMKEKFGTDIFNDRDAYFTMGMLRRVLIDLYGLDESYVLAYDPEEPADESPDWFLPWHPDDYQYVDRDYMAYTVTKLYWPDVVTDWSILKDDTGEYPGVRVAEIWCEDHDILRGVNRPKELSCGEAAVAFANADRVYEAMQKLDGAR